MQRTHRIWAGVLLGIVAGNAIGLGSYLLLAPEVPAEEKSKATKSATVDRVSNEHRLAGLDAIERGDHDAAIREFSAGLRTPSPAPDLTQLLSIAQSMRERELARREEEAVAEAAAAEAEQKGDEAPPPVEPPPPRPALLLVTTRPAKLAIEVDGRVRDLSPARIEVEPGRHKVALRRGEDLLSEQTVRVKAGEVSLIDADVSEAIAALDRPPSDDFDEDVDDVPDEPSRAAAAVLNSNSNSNSEPVDTSTPVTERNGLAAFPYPSAEPAATVASANLGAATPEPARAELSPDASVLPQEPQAPEPAISPGDVRRVAASAQPDFQACYDRFRRGRPELEGRVLLRVQVNAEGRVRRGQVVESTIDSVGINRCLRRVARRMRFPAPNGGPTSVSLALRFAPN